MPKVDTTPRAGYIDQERLVVSSHKAYQCYRKLIINDSIYDTIKAWCNGDLNSKKGKPYAVGSIRAMMSAFQHEYRKEHDNEKCPILKNLTRAINAKAKGEDWQLYFKMIDNIETGATEDSLELPPTYHDVDTKQMYMKHEFASVESINQSILELYQDANKYFVEKYDGQWSDDNQNILFKFLSIVYVAFIHARPYKAAIFCDNPIDFKNGTFYNLSVKPDDADNPYEVPQNLVEEIWDLLAKYYKNKTIAVINTPSNINAMFKKKYFDSKYSVLKKNILNVVCYKEYCGHDLEYYADIIEISAKTLKTYIISDVQSALHKEFGGVSNDEEYEESTSDLSVADGVDLFQQVKKANASKEIDRQKLASIKKYLDSLDL
jgi:hypothetical protein